jgi:hypothetical protein
MTLAIFSRPAADIGHVTRNWSFQMSTNNLDTDTLATEEMLKMFENMESHDLDTDALETMSLAPEPLPETALDNIELMPIEMEHTFPELDEETLEELPDASEQSSMDAELILDNMPEDIVMEDIIDTPEAIAAEEIIDMPEEIAAEEIIDMPEEIATEEVSTHDDTPTETSGNPLNDQLTEVLTNAVQALQDWVALHQESEAHKPQQGLAQLDVLLDTVTHQQQQLAEQLSKAPKVDLLGIASALGVALATPEVLGWTEDQWRSKAESVVSRTDDIAAMNAKLRKQLALI